MTLASHKALSECHCSQPPESFESSLSFSSEWSSDFNLRAAQGQLYSVPDGQDVGLSGRAVSDQRGPRGRPMMAAADSPREPLNSDPPERFPLLSGCDACDGAAQVIGERVCARCLCHSDVVSFRAGEPPIR